MNHDQVYRRDITTQVRQKTNSSSSSFLLDLFTGSILFFLTD